MASYLVKFIITGRQLIFSRAILGGDITLTCHVLQIKGDHSISHVLATLTVLEGASTSWCMYYSYKLYMYM